MPCKPRTSRGRRRARLGNPAALGTDLGTASLPAALGTTLLLAPSDILPAALPLLLPLDPDGLGRQILLTSALLTRCAALGRALLTETKVDVSKQKWNLF